MAERKPPVMASISGKNVIIIETKGKETDWEKVHRLRREAVAKNDHAEIARLDQIIRALNERRQGTATLHPVARVHTY